MHCQEAFRFANLTRLMLADLESLEKRVPAAAKKAASGDKESKIMASVLGQALELLREGKPARLTDPKDDEEARVFAQAQLLTAKPVLYVCNVEEGSAASGNAFSQAVFEHAAKEGAIAVAISAKIESEIATLSRDERTDFLETLGLEEAGLEVADMWDSGACNGAAVSDPSGNRILLHRRYAPYLDGTTP